MGQEDDSIDGVYSVALPGCWYLLMHTHKNWFGVLISAVSLCISLQLLHFFATCFLYLVDIVQASYVPQSEY